MAQYALNMTASAFTRNREYGAIVRTSEDVAEVSALFNADWERTSYVPSRPDLVVSPDNSRSRLMSAPRVLVNDNGRGELQSVSQEPFAEILDTNTTQSRTGLGPSTSKPVSVCDPSGVLENGSDVPTNAA